MKNNTLMIGITMLVLGVVLGVIFSPAEKMTQNPASSHEMHTAMSGMTSGLQGKTGDAFDSAFLSEMIVHHDGAIEMAKLALLHANHEEIKTLATAIIDAQTKEIAQMKAWKQKWYPQAD